MLNVLTLKVDSFIFNRKITLYDLLISTFVLVSGSKYFAHRYFTISQLIFLLVTKMFLFTNYKYLIY